MAALYAQTNGTSRKLSGWLGLWLWLFAPLALAAPQLLDIRYQSLQPGLSEFELVFDDVVVEPVADWANEPNRLILTFDQMVSGLALNEIPVGTNHIQRVTQQTDKGQLQVVFYLDKVLAFAGAADGRSYRVQLTPDGDRLASSRASVGALNGIRELDFRRGSAGEGILQLTLNNPGTAYDVRQQGDLLELEFFNSTISDELLYRLDVTDFATPAAAVETFREQQNVRIRIEPMNDYRYDYRQDGDVLSVVLRPGAELADADNLKIETFEGDLISLSFQDIPVRTVLQILADYNGFNLVTSDTVSGNITLRLEQVPWDQALSIILKAKGLDKREQGNILLIAPADELAEREAQELQNALAVENLRPLYSEIVQVNYAKAKDVAALLKNSESKLLSERGNITVDDRTNTLLVQDTRDKLKEVRDLIKVLDVPVRQVMIEARMVTVKNSVGRDFGARLGFTANSGENGSSGSLGGANDAASGVVPGLTDRLNVDLPVTTDIAIGFVSKLTDGILLDLELSAMESENQGEVIASPRLTTANQKEAEIKQGVQVPYTVVTDKGVSTQFKDALLMLKVTPQITPDQRVILDLEVNQDTVGQIFPDGVGIDTQTINTQVLTENGQTIVLGGIYLQTVSEGIKKVPLLGDLPFVGALFRSSIKKSEKSEVLIFVTPRIIEENLLEGVAPADGWSDAASIDQNKLSRTAESRAEPAAPPAAPLSVAAAPTARSASSYNAQGSWVAQLGAFRHPAKAERLMARYPDLPLELRTSPSRTLLLLMLTGYPTKQAAEIAVNQLPDELRSMKPWIHKQSAKASS